MTIKKEVGVKGGVGVQKKKKNNNNRVEEMAFAFFFFGLLFCSAQLHSSSFFFLSRFVCLFGCLFCHSFRFLILLQAFARIGYAMP